MYLERYNNLIKAAAKSDYIRESGAVGIKEFTDVVLNKMSYFSTYLQSVYDCQLALTLRNEFNDRDSAENYHECLERMNEKYECIEKELPKLNSWCNKLGVEEFYKGDINEHTMLELSTNLMEETIHSKDIEMILDNKTLVRDFDNSLTGHTKRAIGEAILESHEI